MTKESKLKKFVVRQSHEYSSTVEALDVTDAIRVADKKPITEWDLEKTPIDAEEE